MQTKVYAARLKNRTELEKSSSGGMFTAVSDLFLDAGNAVLCSVYDYNEKRTTFSIITDRETRNAARGSKYMQSYPKDIMREGEKWLNENPGKELLFIGTGCQANGFRRFAEARGLRDRVTIVDIICHGAPSPLIWKDYANRIEDMYSSPITYITFKDKRNGWLNPRSFVKVDGKEVSIQLYRNLFSRRSIIRPSCFECPYCRIERETDITIGDFWHIEEKIPDFYDPMGNSVVLVHTDTGMELFERLKYSVDWIRSGKEACWQQNLQRPTFRPKDRELFWKDYKKRGIEYVIKLYGEKTAEAKIRRKVKMMFAKIFGESELHSNNQMV